MKRVGRLISARKVLLTAAWFLVFGLVFTLPAAGMGDAGYHVLAKYAVGGRVGVVRVDSATREIFASVPGRVVVLNADTGARAGTIPVGDPRDILLVPSLGRGFISRGADNSVAMFDTHTLEIIRTIPLRGENPDALAYDPGVGRVFVAETGSGQVVAIQAETGEIVSRVSLSGQLEQMSANGYGELFVAADRQDTIHVVDTQTLHWLGDFPLHPGCRPSALALDPYGRRLFVACRDGILQIIDTDIGFTFETLPIGTGRAAEAFTFEPQGEGGWKGATFVFTSDGTLSLVEMSAFIRYLSAGRVRLPPGTVSLAYDAKTHHLFVPAGSTVLVVGQ